MRAVGVLFTITALVLVQAPWIVCNCEGEGGCGPLFADCECIGHHAEEHARSHGHHHHGHGHAHHHHHHGHPHSDSDEPEEPCSHVGFRVPMGTMPAPVGLDAPMLVLDLALLFDAPIMMACEPQVAERVEPPPGPNVAPSVGTERLLL